MKLGFKGVTPENWLEQDGAAAPWVRVNVIDGTSHPTTGADWIASVNAITLAENVNEQVVTLFEFAKRALGYGHFYYPLFTLVSHQVARVADIAVDVLFDDLQLTPKPRSFDRRIVILRERWLIDDEMFCRLDAMRLRRNRVTHGSFCEIIMPTHAIMEIRWAAELISALPWPALTSTST